MNAVSWRIVRRFVPLAVIAALLVAVVASGLLDHLSLAELKANRAMLSAQVAAHPALSLLVYFVIYVLVVVACVPGPGFMTIAGGFLFGVWLGGAAALASCVVGATIVFQACRTAFGDWAARRAGPVVQRIEAGFARHGFSYLLTLRLIPMVPFFATNVAAGLARVRLRDLVAATMIGTAPAAFVFAGLGAGLGVLFDHGAKADFRLIETPQVMLPLVGLGLLSALPIAWRLIQARRRPR
jgi:uncharacterized membrane protein YdjX (TVP38/TMEM64 family)